MTANRGFASLCVAAGLQPQVLPAFSLSTQELPELGERAELNQLKQAVFTTSGWESERFRGDQRRWLRGLCPIPPAD